MTGFCSQKVRAITCGLLCVCAMNQMGRKTVETMAEIKMQLETLAYLASSAMSVQDRRDLDELLRLTATQIDNEPAGTELPAAVAA